MSDTFDIIVVGGGPAGSAAALHACRRQAGVLLIERRSEMAPGGRTGWLGPAAVDLLGSLGVEPQRVGATPFQGLHLHAWNFREHAFVDDADLHGWFVERARLDAGLREAARQAGAVLRSGCGPRDLALGEESVRLTLDDGTLVRGRVVLIADGTFSDTAQRANLAPAGQSPGMTICLHATCAAPRGSGSLHVVLGASRSGQLATFVCTPQTVSVSLATRDRRSTPRQQFETLWQGAARVGLVPERPSVEPLECLSPCGVALDMDTHVGKRCLLIGDAGGFVGAFSNEGLYPAMRSGCIAVDTALQALRAAVVQDELATFGPAWRRELAEYLRMPNTDLSLLVPLVFQNPEMSRRIARAFLLGQPF